MPLGIEDVHCRLMRRYQDAPLAWYLVVLITMLGIAIYTVEQYVPVPIVQPHSVDFTDISMIVVIQSTFLGTACF